MKYRHSLTSLALSFALIVCGCSDDSGTIHEQENEEDTGGQSDVHNPDELPTEEDDIVESDDDDDAEAEGESESDDNAEMGEGDKIENCSATVCADSTSLAQCDDGVITKLVCENGCENDACVVKEEIPAECTENVCNADVLNQCIEGKIVPQKCEFGCLSGKCLPDPVVSIDGKRILFTGNSQTYYGRIVLCSSGRPSWVKKDSKVTYDSDGFPINNQGVFYHLSKHYGDNVKITNFVWGSAAIAGQRRNSGGGNSSGDCWGVDTSNKICMSSSSKYKSKMYGQLEMMKTLHPHYYNFDGKGRENMDPFYAQDYIVIQQIRNPVQVDIAKDTHLTALQKEHPDYSKSQISNAANYQDTLAVASLFPPETEAFVMLTQWGAKSAYEDGIEDLAAKGLSVVPYGRVAENLWSNRYSDMAGFRKYKKADFLVTKDNSHPNFLVGYLGALGLYATLTNRSIVNDNFYTVEDTEAYAKKKSCRYYVRRESYAVELKYYSNTDETSFGNMLGNDKEMTAIKRHLDEEIAVYDNKLFRVSTGMEQSFGLLEFKRPETMTDRKFVYNIDKTSTYSTLKWAESSEAAKDWKNAPHYDANGNVKEDGKYLAGFYYELPKEELVSRFRLYNPNSTVAIDGFDILTSMDGKDWQIAWSGTKLSTEMKYTLSGYENTNYIQGNFYPVKAKYVMFALTEPRPQENIDIDAYNAKYHPGDSGTKITQLSPNQQTVNISEFEVYRYTAR